MTPGILIPVVPPTYEQEMCIAMSQMAANLALAIKLGNQRQAYAMSAELSGWLADFADHV